MLIVGVLVVTIGRDIRLVDMVVVVPFDGVNETGDRHELVFHRSVDGVLNSLSPHETVEGSLVFDLDTSRVDGLGCDGVEHRLRLSTHDTGIVGTTAGTLF